MEQHSIKKIGIDLLKQLGIILLYLFIIVLMSSLIPISKDANSSNKLLSFLAYISLDIVILTVFLAIFRKKIIPDFYDFKKNGKSYIKNNFHYWIIGLAVLLFSNIMISMFINMPTNEAEVRTLFSENLVYYLVGVIVMAPITEELLTRTVLKDTFKRPFFYYLLSGLIFGFLHVVVALVDNNYLELLYIIPYGALGFAFAKIHKNSNNIWTNIFFHSLHNTIATLLLIIGGV